MMSWRSALAVLYRFSAAFTSQKQADPLPLRPLSAQGSYRRPRGLTGGQDKSGRARAGALGAGVFREPPLQGRFQGSRGSPVHEPDQVPVLGADEIRGVGARVGVALQYLPQGPGLALARDQEGYRPGGVEDRGREGEARGLELEHGVGDDPPVGNVERRGLREEAQRVAVLPEAAEDQVEARRTLPEEPPQLLLVGGSGLSGRQLAAHPVDAADRNVVEQSLARHAVVGGLVVGAYAPLVSEEDVDAIPIDPAGVVAGQRLVVGPRGRAAREGDGEAATLAYGLLSQGGEVAGGGLGELLRRLVDEEVHRSSTSTAARRARS